MSATSPVTARRYSSEVAEKVIAAMEHIAHATPSPCEGSLGHLRGEFAWEIRDDYRRAGARDQGLLDEYEPDDFDEIANCCVRSAARAIVRWLEEDAR